jgi:basic membrane lipoprotein Med (substrate-binding protein (PBP1-ABC) superfamily)
MAIERVKHWLRASLLGLLVVAAYQVATDAAADEPEEVSIALMLSVGPEAPWDKSVIEALDRVAAESPHGLNITYKYFDSVWGDEAESVMRLVASSGDYDILLNASAHSDQIKNLHDEFPDMLWVSLGSGNYNAGPNHYLALGRVHQAAYLLGMLAAGLSESGVIGSVASFPAEDVNDQLNAYRFGAQSVNADIKLKLTFIESWYDPPKAIEATYAQAAAGADIIYQLAGGVYAACAEKEMLCLSKYRDEYDIAPDVVVSGTLLMWDPTINWMLDIWHDHVVNGTPYAGNTESVWFSMAEGGSDIAPYYGLADRIPDELEERIAAAKEAIISGELEIPLVLDVPVPD